MIAKILTPKREVNLVIVLLIIDIGGDVGSRLENFVLSYFTPSHKL